MAVPTFNAEGSGDALGLSARSYLRQLDAWCKVTRAPASQRALLLYQSLGGRAGVEAEELNVDDLGTDAGVSILKAWIQERYQEVEVSKIAEALTQFFRKLQRQPSQTVREFNSAFDRAYARLIEIDCKLPEVAKAWVYHLVPSTSPTQKNLACWPASTMSTSCQSFRRRRPCMRKVYRLLGGSGIIPQAGVEIAGADLAAPT